MKNIIRIICAIIIVSLAVSLLASCGEDAKGTDSAASSGDTAASDVSTSESAADTAEDTQDADTGDSYVNPLEGLETVAEDLSDAEDDEGGISMREYKYLKTVVYTGEDGSEYNWLQFYNACVKGELKLADPAVAEYARACLEDFEAMEFSAIAEQAKTIVDAAAGLNG